MKKKISKIWGIGLTFVMVVSLMLIAAPSTAVLAADPVTNEWDLAAFPDPGEDGDWFWHPDISSVGPIAEAINGDLYAYAGMVDLVCTLTDDGAGTAEWSTDEAYSGSYSAKLTAPTVADYAKAKVTVSAAFSGFVAPSFYYKISSDAVATMEDIGATWPIYVRLGDTVTNGYFSPYPVIHISDGVTDHWIVGQQWAESTQVDWTEWDNAQASGIYSEALWHMETFAVDPGIGGGVPAGWGPLSYWTGTAYPAYDVVDVGIGLGYFAVTGQQSAYVDDITVNGLTYCLETPILFKSTDGGRSWEETDYADDLTGEGAIVDIVCSSIDEDTLYVTDGNYVYKTDDGGDDWTCVADEALEAALQGTCGIPIIGRPITSIDVGYQDEDPFVFIGTRAVMGVLSSGSVYYLDEEAYGADWVDMNVGCEYAGYDVLAVGCAPDFDDSNETYVVVSSCSEDNTYVIYTDGGICEWHDFAELLYNCTDSFGSILASRIGFPDDWEDTETLFVGVVDCEPCVDEADPPLDQGGDVYSVSDGECLDRNVRPGTGGCTGESTDIISLDVCGDTDSGSVVAGAYCDTTVYYSSDGGWEWDPSVKSPTGEDTTYVLWYGDCGESVLAATAGCEAAVSLSCVSDEDDADDVGESFNQISLIGTCISCVLDVDHSPGYVTDSSTLYLLTKAIDCCFSYSTYSLFRNDGTYWDRVFSTTTYYDDFIDGSWLDWVQVSPDFLDTETVFVANDTFNIFRSQDAGCSWNRLAYPCDPTDISAWAVLDEDTIYVGDEDGYVHLTERHGGRPWDECLVEDADDGTPAGYIMYFAFDITDGAMTILVGDDESQVFLCEVDPDEDWEDQEWHLVGDCQYVLGDCSDDTSVGFDPGYAVTDDVGENMIYAAAGSVIARCIIDWDEDWADQEWEKICDDVADAWGMKVLGDTVLYVGDSGHAPSSCTDTGVWRSLNPTEEDEEDVVFEILEAVDSAHESEFCNAKLSLRQLTAGANGCPDSNVLWAIGEQQRSPWCTPYLWFYEDTLATPVVLTSPADGAQIGKTDEVTLSWEALCDAECYEVELYRYCAECPDDKEEVDLSCDSDCCCNQTTYDDDDAVASCFECDEECVGCSDETCCLFVADEELEPGSTYYWRIRACDPVLSKWSELSEFNTEMTAIDFWDLCSPDCGADDIIITPNFSWDAVSGATSYEVQLATNEAFDPVLASGTPTTNAWLGAPELDYGTTYYWRVRVVKDGITSDWVTCIFTTIAEPAAEQFCCPQCGLCFDTQAELEAHWDAMHAPVAPSTPMYIWLIIGIGALLVIAVLILIVRTRRTV